VHDKNHFPAIFHHLGKHEYSYKSDYYAQGKIHLHRKYPLGDINIDHSDNLNHPKDNVSKDYVDIPHHQTNESYSLVKITPQQDYAP